MTIQELCAKVISLQNEYKYAEDFDDWIRPAAELLTIYYKEKLWYYIITFATIMAGRAESEGISSEEFLLALNHEEMTIWIKAFEVSNECFGTINLS